MQLQTLHTINGVHQIAKLRVSYVDLEKCTFNINNKSQDLLRPFEPGSCTLEQIVSHMWPPSMVVELVAYTQMIKSVEGSYMSVGSVHEPLM